MSGVIAYDVSSSGPVGEPNVVAIPKNYVRGSKTGVIFCHAAQENEAPWLTTADQSKTVLIGKTSGLPNITSAGLFGAGTDNVPVQGPGIPPATHIISHSDPSNALMSAAATDSLAINAKVGGKYVDMFYAPVEAGYPVISTYMGGDLWGNDAAIAFIEAARVHLINDVGAKNGPVMMIGTSMGGLSVYNYMRAHPANVSTAVLVCPVSDVTKMAGGFQAEINAAYGGTYSDAVYGALHNPIDFCTLLADTPMQLWVADDDATADPVAAINCINAFHQADVHHMLGGHNNINDMDIAKIVTWLDAHQ